MDNLIGHIVDNYRFLSILGKGGMGTVYLAYDEKLKRKVAIKVLNTSNFLNRTRIIERFRVEAQNHAQLIHQNIVTVYGFIEFDDQFAIVMEYVDGESLDKVIEQSKRLHIHDVIYIIKQLLEGVQFAHNKGYIHRDIKPSNIIVNTDGIVKIMDFGISQSVFEKEHKTRTGSRVGTIYYMSPEQIQGENISRQSDIYSIGCTMYELITGYPPFYSENEYEVMDGHLHQRFAPINDFLPELSEKINKILSLMLNKLILDRYQSCIDALYDLKKLDKYLVESTSDYFTHRRKKKILSKKKSVIIFSIMIAVFLALVVFVFTQVKEFMSYSGYTIFEDGKKIENSIINFDSSFVLSPKINLRTSATISSGIFMNDSNIYMVGDSALFLKYDLMLSSYQRFETKIVSEIMDIEKISDNKFLLVGKYSTICLFDEPILICDTVTANDSHHFYRVDFFDQKTGIIIGTNGIILRSTNGGKDWDNIESFNDNNLFDIEIINENTCFIVGSNGTILRSADIGLTWKNITVDSKNYLKSIIFMDQKNGIIVGGGGTILRTNNGGEKWEAVNSVTAKGLNKVKLIGRKVLLTVGNLGVILSSYDSGQTWKTIESNYFNNWNDILVNSYDRIFLIGDNGTFIEIFKGVK